MKPNGSLPLLVLLVLNMLLASSSPVKAQVSQKGFLNQVSNNWSLEVNGGALIFYGDIKEKDFVPTSKPKNELQWGSAVALNYRVNELFSLSGQYMNGKLVGMNTRLNSYFQADIRDFGLMGQFTLNDVLININREKAEFFGFAGVGFLYFRSVQRSLDSNAVISVQGYRLPGLEKKKRTTEFMLPVGLGTRINLNQFIRSKKSFSGKWFVTASMQIHTPGTDKLDSEVSPVKSGRDSYSYFSLGICYRFGPVQRIFSTQLGGRAMRRELRKLAEQVKKIETDISEGFVDIPKELPKESAKETQREINSPAVMLQLPMTAMPEITIRKTDLSSIPSSSNSRLFFNPDLIQLSTTQIKETFRFAAAGKAAKQAKMELVAYVPFENTNDANVYIAKRRIVEIYTLLVGTLGIPPARVYMSILLYTPGRGREAFQAGSKEVYDIIDLIIK